jgi:hypothetical protein
MCTEHTGVKTTRNKMELREIGWEEVDWIHLA